MGLGQMFIPELQPFILLLMSSLISFVVAWFWSSRKVATKIREQKAIDEKVLVDRIAEVEVQLKLLSQTVIPISTAFQAILIKELTHPHAQEFDELLSKVGTLVPLNDEEQARLAKFLGIRGADLSGSVSSAERDAANILPEVMRRTLAEQAELAVGQHVKVNRKFVSPGIGQIDFTTNHPVQ